MKQFKYLLLLLMAIVVQGAWGQSTPTGSGTPDDPYVIGVGEWTFTLPYTSGELNFYSCMNMKNFKIFQFEAPKDGKIEIISSANKDIQYTFYDSNKSYMYSSKSMSLFECADEWFESGKTYYIGLRCTGGQVNGGLLTVNYYCKNHENTEVIPGTATCTQGGTIEYMLCHDCGGRFTNDEEQYRLDDWDINVGPLGHDLDGCVCTRCEQEVGLTLGEKVINLPAGDYQETVYQFTAATTGTLDVSLVTDAYVEDMRIVRWSEYVNGPASAPRKAARIGEAPEPYTVSQDVRAGENYAIVFTTSAEDETTATVNVSYSNVYIEGNNINLETVLAENPNVTSFSFQSWSNITASTITRNVIMNLEYGTTFIGQLKIDNGAKVEINGGGNLSFRNMSEGSFSVIVENGDLTCTDIANFNYNYNNGAVLVKKGSFTANGARIHGTEAIVARKSLGSTDDVAINIINGAEVWGTRLAIYMDVNGHLTIDNPGTYQGIQGDDQSIVVKAGTVDLSNIQEDVIRTNGPVGSDIGVRIPEVHENSIPYLDGVPAVALQVGTAEEGFTGTTVLRMRNVILVPSNLNGSGETNGIDYQKVLITGSAAHPTSYQLTNVKGQGQIVVENPEYVEEVGVVAVHDGENTNVNFPVGQSQVTAFKYVATESKVLEVTATTNATIENCSIIPWSEWDGEEEDDNNGNVQYARRKASALNDEEPADNILASKKVVAGNSYAIVFTTTSDVETVATITLNYLDYPVVTIGENTINIDDVDGDCYDDDDSPNVDSSCYNVYKFVAPKTGDAHIYTYGGEDTFCLLFDSNFNYLTDEDGTSDNDWMDFDFTWSVEEGEIYYLGIRHYFGNSIGTYPLVIELESIPEFDGTLALSTEEDGSITDIPLNQAVDDYFGKYTKTQTFVVGGVTYTRPMTTSKWGTVILPYELQSNNKVAYYELVSADIPNASLEFSKVDVVEPNTPVVYHVLEGDVFDASVEDVVKIDYKENPLIFKECIDNGVEQWSMVGFYVVFNMTQDVINDVASSNEGFMYINKDQFWHAEGPIRIKPYRAIFDAIGVNWNAALANSMRISFKDDNGVTTTIDSVIEENGEFTDVEAIYDLNGRQRNTIQRGVNIIRTADGKTRKFIKK